MHCQRKMSRAIWLLVVFLAQCNINFALKIHAPTIPPKRARTFIGGGNGVANGANNARADLPPRTPTPPSNHVLLSGERVYHLSDAETDGITRE